MKKISCILVDDENLSRTRLEYLLSKFDEIEILASESNPETAIDVICKKKPEIIFLDIEMPRISGFELAKKCNYSNYAPAIVFVTANSQYAVKAIKIDAFDYLIKPIDIDELKETIERFKLQNSTKKSNTNTHIPQYHCLSERERQVLRLLVRGSTSKQIANELFIGKTTVDTHRLNILKKTGARNTSELIIMMLDKTS